jgi:hypothetical protein
LFLHISGSIFLVCCKLKQSATFTSFQEKITSINHDFQVLKQKMQVTQAPIAGQVWCGVNYSTMLAEIHSYIATKCVNWPYI